MSEAMKMGLYFKKEYLQHTGRLVKLMVQNLNIVSNLL